jgi:hypothetical protein
MRILKSGTRAFLLAAVCSIAFTPPLAAQGQDGADVPPPAKKITSCNDDPGFHEMDFWLGEWVVKVGNRVVGTNRIQKILKGCAIMEHWTGSDGGQARSIFYYDSAENIWSQVWVTEAAYAPGGLKKQSLVERMNGGGLRFEGQIKRGEGDHYLERTTLTPRPDGTVRQWTQLSTDGGEMWTSVFDAMYERKGRGTE